MSSLTSEAIFTQLNEIEILPLNNQEKTKFYRDQIRALSDILIQQYCSNTDTYHELPDYAIFLLTNHLVQKANFYAMGF